MSSSSRSSVIGCLFSGVFAATLALAQAGSTNIPNWTVPPHRSQSETGGLQTMTDISDAAIFVATTTCRVFDTRDPVGPYGGPRLTANVTRNFDVNSGPCSGIPAGVSAYSMNFGAILPDSAGFITIWDTGSPIPTSSFMNTLPGAVIANAAIIPSSISGSISVFSNTGVHLYGDINGYFMSSGGSLNSGRSIAWTGNHPADFMFVFNTNTTASSGFTNAIHGYMTSNQDFVAAIRGEMANVSGANYGVTGVTGSASGNSAGLRAHNGSGPVPGVFNSAGARGETAGNGIGVLGLTSGGGVGVGGYYLSAGGSVLSGAGSGFTSTVGLAVTGNTQATGTKGFIEPHPTDPSRVIRYVSLEGNEAGTYFRGRGKFQNGIARIGVPEDFRIVTDPEGLTVQITPIGAMASFAVMKMDLHQIVARASRDVEFSYLVQGIRHAYRDSGPIAENEKTFVPTSPDEPMPAYLPTVLQQRLVSNGTYTADGKVNIETARRLGWDKIWEQRSRPAPEPVEP